MSALAGLRRLARHRAYPLLAIATLAVGCGGLGAVMGLTLNALRRPLPYPRAESLVVLSSDVHSGGSFATVHFEEFEAIRQNLAPLLADVGFGDDPEPRMVEWASGRRPASVEFVSSGVFDTLGVAAAAGRTFQATDDEMAAGGSSAVVLRWGYWKNLGAKAPPIGGTLRISGADYRLVGVMPAGFAWRAADIWAILPPNAAKKRGGGLEIVARLRPAAGLRAANSALRAALLHTTVLTWPDDAYRLTFVSLRRIELGSTWSELLALASGSLALYGICWLGFAALTLGLWVHRANEVRTRRALGASPWQLSGLWLGESGWAAALGAVSACLVGLLISHWLQAAVLAGTNQPQILGVAAAAAAGSALFAGLTAGWAGFAAASAVAGERLQPARRKLRGRLRWVLIGELLLVVPTLILALDFAVSAARVRAVRPGYAVREVTVAQVEGRRFAADQKGGSLLTARILTALRRAPWVQSAASSSDLPMGGTRQMPFLVSLHPEKWGASAELTGISPGYFELLGIPLLHGRLFTPADAASSRTVFVINRKLADLYWPGLDPVGRTLYFDDNPADGGVVVGVAGDSRNLNPLVGPYPQLFYLIGQGGQAWRTTYFMVRSQLPTGAAAERLRQTLNRMSSTRQPIFVASTFPLAQVLSSVTDPYQRRGLIWAVLAALLLSLCAISLFGVARFWAGVQRRDLAVRIALGAPRAAIVQVFLRQFGIPVMLGTAGGCALAVAPARLAVHFIYGSPPLSAAVWLAAAAITASVCAAAILGPGLLSAKLDVAEILRAV